MEQRGKRGGRGVAAAACVLLCGCATSDAAGPTSTEAAGLFRTSSRVGDLAPAPTAGWYVPRQTPRYVKMGLAREAAPPRRSWLARLFAPQKAAAPTAVIAETAALPLPSVVQIENVLTGAVTRVRIDERAPLGDDLVRLNAATARELGVSPSQPLLVRVRFVEPAIAYRQGQPMTYALGRRAKPETQLAAASKPAPAPPPAVVDAPVVTARLEAPAQLRVPPKVAVATAPVARPTPAPVRVAAAPQPPPPAVRPMLLRIQAGAFANPGNAQRAVGMLTSAGQARIQPVRRADGVTLYRVFVDCPNGAQAAEAVRAKVVRAGFADARIVRAS